MSSIIASIIVIVFFFLAAVFEIGGGYVLWLWIREKRRSCLLLGAYLCFWCCVFLGGLLLFIYGLIPTLQPANFGRVFAAYGGIFIVASIMWGWVIDHKKPDKYELIGGSIALLGGLLIFFAPH